MTKSIMQDEKVCYLCGRAVSLERHHCMSGTANRKLSEKYGLWVWLCHNCHTGDSGAQYERENNRFLRVQAQMAFEHLYGHDAWMKTFLKNYIY
jgi:hypothetical protein